MLIKRSIRLALQTRRQSDIENEVIWDLPDDGLLLQSEALRKEFPDQCHRPVRPGQTCNCHGLTFAARRTRIWKSEELAKILDHDGYKRIERKDVLPGDIAIYYSPETGEPEHSGIVISNEAPPALPRILSKVGNCHEMVHYAEMCKYDATDIRYYRVIS